MTGTSLPSSAGAVGAVAYLSKATKLCLTFLLSIHQMGPIVAARDSAVKPALKPTAIDESLYDHCRPGSQMHACRSSPTLHANSTDESSIYCTLLADCVRHRHLDNDSCRVSRVLGGLVAGVRPDNQCLVEPSEKCQHTFNRRLLQPALLLPRTRFAIRPKRCISVQGWRSANIAHIY